MRDITNHVRSSIIYVFIVFGILRFGGKQILASIDDGSVNHALIRDLEEETDRLEKFGAELEAD